MSSCTHTCYWYIAIPLLQVQFIKTKAPQLIKKAEEDITNVERTMEQLHTEEDQLVGDVCNHLVDVQPLVTMLESLTGQIRELEKYSQYLHCLAQIEDLRFLFQYSIHLTCFRVHVHVLFLLLRILKIMLMLQYCLKLISLWESLRSMRVTLWSMPWSQWSRHCDNTPWSALSQASTPHSPSGLWLKGKCLNLACFTLGSCLSFSLKGFLHILLVLSQNSRITL